MKGKVIYFLLVLFSISSFILMSKALFLGYYPDFITQYKVPQLVSKGVNPYRKNEVLYTPQVYPPTEFIFFLPITFLPQLTASYLYTFFSILCIPLSLFLLAKIFGVNIFSKTSLLISALTFMSFPAKFTLGMGQINNYILLLLVIVLFFLVRKKELYGGIFAGIVLSIKMFPILLPLYFLYTKKFKILAGFCLWLLISSILVFALVDKKILYDFFFNILPSFLSSWKIDYYNQAVSGFIARSFGINQFSTVLKFIVSIGVVVLCAIALKKQKKENISLSYGLIITANLLINTFSWQHHFVWLLIPYYAAVSFLLRTKKNAIWFLFTFVSYLLVSMNFKNPNLLPVFFQSHVFYGTLMLFAIQVRLLIDKRKV